LLVLGTLSANGFEHVRFGMSEEEVFRILRAPAIDERILCQEANYDVWFYEVKTASEKKELVPLIFKDGLLVASGSDQYSQLLARRVKSKPVSQSNKPTAPQPKPSDSPEEEEKQEEEKPYRWSEEDQRMIEQEQDQNMDYW